jgi:dihydropteroate synthase
MGNVMVQLKSIRCGPHTITFDRTLIMGILNVTPDSFSDGGLYVNTDAAVAHAKKMVADGADIIDVGGESSRPGSAPLTEQEELQRVLPVLSRLQRKISVPISIDTYKPKVAAKCLDAGATIINDITGLTNPDMVKVASEYRVPVVMMHMKGSPQTMQENPEYKDVIGEIRTFFEKQIAFVSNEGIETIILDPGIGFGKTVEHNLMILCHLNVFTNLCCPVLVGPSRKNFLGVITGLPIRDRIEGTIAAVTAAVLNGANIVRVHDVKECKRAVQVADAIRGIR